MELFILIIALAILAETTVLTIANRTPLKTGKRKIYVDTSALIDGRILPIARTGFISGDLIIPRSVIRELQLLADGKDSEKRIRARAGMDVARDLERVIDCNVIILEDTLDRTPVDERLLSLAKENPGSAILTTDFNLGKVASTEKISILNVNDLAVALHDEFHKGEKLTVKITEKGSNPGQGVGHLLDGAMVVVDKAANKVGKTIQVEVTRYVQNTSGRIVFAKIRKG